MRISSSSSRLSTIVRHHSLRDVRRLPQADAVRVACVTSGLDQGIADMRSGYVGLFEAAKISAGPICTEDEDDDQSAVCRLSTYMCCCGLRC